MVKPWGRCYYTVWALLAIFVVVGAFGAAAGEQGAMYDAFRLTRQGVLQGEIWRLVSYPFLTSGTLSLLFTVLIFYYIGMPLELIWGTARFLTLFLVSVLGGAAAGVLLNVPLAGGEAPIVTLMLIYGFLFPESVVYLFLILPIRVKTLAIIITAWYLVQLRRPEAAGAGAVSRALQRRPVLRAHHRRNPVVAPGEAQAARGRRRSFRRRPRRLDRLGDGARPAGHAPARQRPAADRAGPRLDRGTHPPRRPVARTLLAVLLQPRQHHLPALPRIRTLPAAIPRNRGKRQTDLSLNRESAKDR